MLIRPAYIGIVLIWSTTPLAVQWSSVGGGYAFGLMMRMLIGLAVLYLLFSFLQKPFARTRTALTVYGLSGFGIYASMFLVYWGAQYIPSGWIAVVFGLSPIVTGVLSAFLLVESGLTIFRLLGIFTALIGLMVIFNIGSQMSINAIWGLMAVLLSTITHSLSAVLIKRVDAPLTGMEATLGGLALATPLLAMNWILFSDPFESASVPERTWFAIAYLGIIATAFGFSLYYYVLRNMDAVRVSTITLVTPVTALLLGKFLNNEPLTASILFGASLVTMGLAVFQFEKFFSRRLSSTSG